MKDEEFVCLMIFIFVIVFFLIGCGIDSYSCMSKAVKQGLQYSYGIMQGCMVREQGGKWIDYDRLRTMN